MTDRSTSGPRPQPGAREQSPGSGGFSFLPALFGRRYQNATNPPASQSRDQRAISATRTSSIKEATSPRSRSQPRQFHLEDALTLMDMTKSQSELAEIVRATAIWLYQLSTKHTDLFTLPQDPLLTSDIHTLYRHAMGASMSSFTTLREAGVKLLTSLLLASPINSPDTSLPQSVTPESVYQVLKANLNESGRLVDCVRALSLLTQSGIDTEHTPGLVQNLLDGLTRLSSSLTNGDVEDVDDWLIAPFDPAPAPNPVQAMSSSIKLITSILRHHAALLGASDVDRIMGGVFGAVRMAIATNGAKAKPLVPSEGSSTGSPATNETRHQVSSQSRPIWPRLLPDVFNFIDTIIANLALSLQQFIMITAHICLLLGQNATEEVAINAWQQVESVLAAILHQRRVEQALLALVEQDTPVWYNDQTWSIERTRGALMSVIFL